LRFIRRSETIVTPTIIASKMPTTDKMAANCIGGEIAIPGVVSLGLLVSGAAYFRRSERQFADVA